MAPGSIIPAAGSAAANPVQFAGPRGELILLLIKNFFLNLVTLGIYRFWARTHLRAYFWRNVAVDDEPIEYVGRGVELFIGFLIVLAILMSIGLPHTILQFLFLSFGPVVQAILDFAYTVVLFVLIQIAIFRARRYRLTRTVWRGIRCGQDGESGQYALISSLYMLLVLVTLGLAHPWRRVALQSYLMNNTRFGRQHFSFEGSGLHLLPIWVGVTAAWWGFVVAIIAFNPEISNAIYELYAKLFAREDISNFVWPQVEPVYWPFALVLIPMGLRLWYGVTEFRYFVARTRFGDIEFGSALRVRSIVWYVVVYLLIMIVGIAATFAVFAGVIAMSALGDAGGLAQAVSPILAFVAFFVLFGLLSIVRVGWLYYEILRTVCRTLSLSSLETIERVVQEADDGVRFGEGLADVLDYGDI